MSVERLTLAELVARTVAPGATVAEWVAVICAYGTMPSYPHAFPHLLTPHN